MPLDSILRFAWPADAAGWVLLVAALASIGLVPRVWPRLQAVRLPGWIAAWAVFAAVGSAAYIVLYLRGGPRIIDATSYWLAARGLAEGTPSWEVMAPTASFRGRFLLTSLHDSRLSVGVIFPPGYPTVLALGFLLRAPMAVGPLLGAALVIATALLARHVTGHSDGARIAAVISSLNACLRYHTADTMSHGLAALCLVGAVLLAVRGSCQVRPAAAAACWTVAGFLAAWLLLTRPASAVALVAVGLPVVTYGALRRRTAAPLWALAGAAPALVWLAIHQHAVTGSWWQLSQTSYYLLADGPAGCFRYGFGEGIGCRVEHGPYVESVLPDGYGLLAALRTTGRRLHLHLADVMNCAPFAVLVPVGAWITRRRAVAWLASVLPAALVLAYAPFYFDASYPGGGARLLSEALPFEHALIAGALCAWAVRFPRAERGTGWAIAAAVAIPCSGFALHASHRALALRDRDGGRPLYEAAVVEAALGPAPRGLLFVDTDHGFNLAFDAGVRHPNEGLLVARARYDDRDRLLWEKLGRPTAWLYRIRPWDAPHEPPHLELWSPAPSEVWRFEGEAEWPVLAQQGGYAAATHLDALCVSGHQALGLVATSAKACASMELPFPHAGAWDVQPWVVVRESAGVELSMRGADGSAATQWEPAHDPAGLSGLLHACVALPEKRIVVDEPGTQILTMCTGGPWAGLDRVQLSAATADID